MGILTTQVARLGAFTADEKFFLGLTRNHRLICALLTGYLMFLIYE